MCEKNPLFLILETLNSCTLLQKERILDTVVSFNFTSKAVVLILYVYITSYPNLYLIGISNVFNTFIIEPEPEWPTSFSLSSHVELTLNHLQTLKYDM